MLPAEWKQPRWATEQDVLAAIVLLGSLPKRDSDQAVLDLAAYRVALDFVPFEALSTAIHSILQGGLGHAFFPSPPELRIACDKADAARLAAIEREARQEKARREAAEYRPIERDEASKARVRAMHEKFSRESATARLADMAMSFRSRLPNAPNVSGRLGDAG